MSFVTDAEVKASVAAALAKEPSALESKWTTLIADANTAAYDQICHRFILQGYSQAQIDAWDRGATFQKFLARYQALIDGAGDHNGVETWEKQLDYWRGKLEEIETLDDGGTAEEPENNSQSSVGHGSLSTSNDLFGLDPNDRRRGRPTEW